MSNHDKTNKKRPQDVAETTRPDTPALEGGVPLPEELTGRASGTEEDVTTLFANDSADHFADGFRGGSNNDPGSDVVVDETDSTPNEDVTAV